MNSDELWQRYCKYHRSYPELGFSLDISRIRFSDDFLENMQGGITAAFEAMSSLEAGEIANPDEGRMVGHYWLRKPELAPSADVTDAINSENKKIKEFAAKIHQGTLKPQRHDRFEHVLIIGIGGSALGPQLVSEALWHKDNPMSLHFVDNTDPDGIAKTLSKLGDSLEKTLAIIVSKSGGTVETRNGSLEVAHAFKARGLDYGPHAVAVTCEGSKLDAQSKSENWLEQIYMWDWVGGRTSIFAAVGLLPAALQGLDIDAFLEGGKMMDELTRTPDSERNPAALMAMMWYAAGNGKGEKDMVVLPYKDRLMLFSKYLQQLVMESLGKEKDLDGKVVNQGLAVYGNKGSTDQHAYVQQLRDGLNNFFVTFVEVLSDYTADAENVSNLEVEEGITSGDYLSGFFLGTRRALYEGGRDSMTITLDALNANSLGALIALYDRTVGFYASLVNVNAYHQPGVEAGKKAATQVIDLQKKLLHSLQSEKKKGTATELAVLIGNPEEAETAFKILQHLSSNSGRGIERSGEGPTAAQFRYRG